MFKHIIAALALFVLSATTYAQVVVVPPNLAPGDSYRLVFVTSTEDVAMSTDLTSYDSIVQAAAAGNAALDGITWQVIASTDSVDAIDHTNTSPTATTQVPIFRLDGANVANDYVDLWDESINSPINIDESGATLNVEVWTGTAPDGTSNGGVFGLGTFSIPGPRFGFSAFTSIGWTIDGVNNVIFDRHFYGISNILTVPGGMMTLLGDADLSGVVDFGDIPAFIAVLQSGDFLDEADVNEDGMVDFSDIPAFIAVLSAQ